MPAERDQALHEALAATRAIGHKTSRAWVLAVLVPHLVPAERHQVLHEALDVARAIGAEERRAEVLAVLAPHLAKITRETLYPLWNATLQLSVTRSRTDLMTDLTALIPVITALGGVEAIAETCRAIKDVGRWWP
jgi:hypothetical protein